RVGHVALEHLGRDRQSDPRAQQTIHDLRPITAVITAVAVLRQRTAATSALSRIDPGLLI
ncbi:MAG TPA: hypothetical protein VH374_16650, partial [Polyangia bacterium]|nr:hypothetical protein [Polyangia bacterium]